MAGDEGGDGMCSSLVFFLSFLSFLSFFSVLCLFLCFLPSEARGSRESAAAR